MLPEGTRQRLRRWIGDVVRKERKSVQLRGSRRPPANGSWRVAVEMSEGSRLAFKIDLNNYSFLCISEKACQAHQPWDSAGFLAEAAAKVTNLKRNKGAGHGAGK